ncbi:unnamed protein product [Vicia faba]|uniref:Gag1-like clamp domain-containing protein n=1 Tax=Vicia faba TaxID=3906 RepID=A0AAV1A774_VICFA|nr:unnamed protein product [Vicia faba]
MYSRCCLLPLFDRFSIKKLCCSIFLFCCSCFRILLVISMEKFKLKFKGIFSSIGCLRSREKPSVGITMDEGIQGQTVIKNDGSSDFWSSSAYEKDNSAAPSMRSVSSSGITMNSSSDLQSNSSSQINPHEFVNQGLIVWNQIRQQWGRNKRPESKTEDREPKISSNAAYEDLLGNNKPFPKPIPLREMINFLIDIWEQDGLYD